MALSVGSPRLGVTQHRALWSSDFPRTALVCSDEARLCEKAARDRLACLGTNLTIAHTSSIVKQIFDKMLSMDYHLNNDNHEEGS